jgi:hypothetical protein
MASKRNQKPKFEFSSAGKWTTVEDNGKVNHNMSTLSRVHAARAATRLSRQSKTAGLFEDGNLGPSNIADSNNIGYYSYQFPVDALEMPASRAEELEFYRLAYTRDPIVARAIDLHTELPVSKMKLEKSKCSVESFSDYVFDYFQRLINDTRMFSEIIQATREYHTVGEAFLYIEQPEHYLNLKLSPTTAKALKKGRGFQAGVSPMTEAANAPLVGQEREILPDFITARGKQSSLATKRKIQSMEIEFADAGVKFEEKEDPDDVQRIIVRRRAKLSKLLKQQLRALRIAALVEQGIQKEASRILAMKTAAPGDAPPADVPAAGDAMPAAGDVGADTALDGGDEGADAGLDNLEAGGDLGSGGFDGGSFGGRGGRATIPSDMAESADAAVTTVEDAKRDREINDLKRYIHLLERKKELLEELKDLAEKRALEKEIFSHVVNDDYEGFDRIQILQPERITITNENGEQPLITYKPSDGEKMTYLEDPEVPQSTKDMLEEKGLVPLNQDPFQGSYVLHFARKKSGYELHGRSALQSCMRAIIYREKLRQVQTTLASRNMTPKTLITAPGVSEVQVAQLRAHADEAKSDPDYTIVCNYEVTWNEIDSQSRLLNLSDEWQHTNSNLAIGLGFSPEILIGEGMYGNNRIQLDMMGVTYTQYREELSDLIENKIFKPIAMLKGFYENDNYGRPRWIYPRITFGALALRDSNDLYEMLFNLYSKGSLPISAIYDLLGLDSETVTRELSDDLFSVRDSKFNELLSSTYSSLGQELIAKTDIVNRLSKNMNLTEQMPDPGAMEGTGEGL